MASSYTPHRPDLAPPDRLHVGGQEREIEIAPGVPMRFCWCPPGEFLMGSPESEVERRDNETLHTVRLTQGFWLAKHHVTQRQWQTVMGDNPSQTSEGDEFPVDSVSWDRCMRFCSNLGIYLPAEAQWEYACRAGTQTAVAIGGGSYLNAQIANFDDGYQYGDGPNVFPWRYRDATLPVACFLPNAWGLHDMHGQLWEWCHDSQGNLTQEVATDPLNAAAGEDRVQRGGCWFFRGGFARSAFRRGNRPDHRSTNVGLRPGSTRPATEVELLQSKPNGGA